MHPVEGDNPWEDSRGRVYTELWFDTTDFDAALACTQRICSQRKLDPRLQLAPLHVFIVRACGHPFLSHEAMLRSDTTFSTAPRGHEQHRYVPVSLLPPYGLLPSRFDDGVVMPDLRAGMVDGGCCRPYAFGRDTVSASLPHVCLAFFLNSLPFIHRVNNSSPIPKYRSFFTTKNTLVN